MSNQLAKMYLRGSLYSVVMKNLTEEQKFEIDDIIESVINEPLLQQCRYQFKKALANTIRNEYSGKAGEEVAEQDFRIAVMRAAIAAKHGWGSNKPADQALTNPIQKKKFFQTWVFNYLRQILRENKIPTINANDKVTVGCDTAILYQLKDVVTSCIENEKDVEYRRHLRFKWSECKQNDTDTGYDVFLDHNIFPVEIEQEILDLSNLYFKCRNDECVKADSVVKIEKKDYGYSITRIKDVDVDMIMKRSSIVKEVSFSGKDDDSDEGKKDMLEAQIMNNSVDYHIVDEDDIIYKLKKNIPEEAQRVLDIYIDYTRPDEYIEKYGEGSPKIVHIAEYLDMSTKEVKNHLRSIKHHCLALGIGR